MFASKKVRTALFIAVLLLISVCMYVFNQSPEKTYNDQGGTSYASYEKAKVLKVVSEELEKDPARRRIVSRISRAGNQNSFWGTSR